jgi:outer membrane lipoprotein
MRQALKTSASIFAVAAAAALSGCATVPTPLAGNDFAPTTPQQAVAQNLPAGQRVRWGGEIIKVEPRSDRTCFEVLSRELYADARPNRSDKSDGRFLACKTGFYDPALYEQGRDVTVVGTIGESEHHKVGQYDYTYAKVDATEVYLWPKRSYPPGFYDPYWGPCMGDPFWGPGWYGPGWGPGWGGCGRWGWGGGYWGRPVIVAPPPPPKSGK